MLTAQQAFKFGFLSRCVADGLTPPQIAVAAEKAAAAMEKQALIGELAGKGIDLVKGLGSYALPAAILAPPIAGGLAAYGMHRATDIHDRDVDDVKDDEVIQELGRQAARLRRLKTLRDTATPSSGGGRPLLR